MRINDGADTGVKALDAGFRLLQRPRLVAHRVNAIGKLARPLTPEAADRFIRRLLIRDPLPITSELMLAGAALSRRFRLSYWDGAIVAAAKVLECRTLFSEDLHHGQNIVGVRVMNPFA